jgi:crossover junction endodeoxyribonuclease RuvC
VIVVGIDPGKSGAVVAIDSSNLLPVGAWYAEQDYCSSGEYQDDRMAEVMRCCAAGAAVPKLVLIERQHAMPKQGGTSCLTIGIGFGLWRGICAGLGLPREIVSAPIWQKEMFRGVPGADKKDQAARVAQMRVPSLNLFPGRRRKPHDGLADACCLALWGIRQNVAEGRLGGA